MGRAVQMKRVVQVADLPAGTYNYHWTKSLVASRDGSKLFVGVGSNSNAGENGMDAETGRAAIVAPTLTTGLDGAMKTT